MEGEAKRLEGRVEESVWREREREKERERGVGGGVKLCERTIGLDLPKKLLCVAIYVLSNIWANPPNAPTILSMI